MTEPDCTVRYLDHLNALHRVGGPAVIHPDGSKEWFEHGNRHRLDGPAATGPDGFELWCVNGVPHRVDGPAVTSPDGYTQWWIDGERRHDLEQEANKDG